VAFPRVNALSWYIFLFSGLLLWTSFFVGQMPDAGWFNYVPLSGPDQATDHGIDFWLVSIVFLTISTTAGAVNIIATVFKMRAPGMTVRRVPLFICSMLDTSFAVVFAYPALTAANILLYMDRHYDTHFFDLAAHGSSVLWQHLFW